MRYARHLSGAVMLLVVLVATGAAAAEPYSPEDAIRQQHVNSVRFAPDGERVVIEHTNLASDNFAFNAKLFWTDLRGSGNGGAVLSHPGEAEAQEDGYAWASLSPDSRHAAYLHYHRDSVNAAVYDFRSRRSTEFDVAPESGAYMTWISDHEVMFPKVSPGTYEYSFIGQMSLQWRKMREGSSNTASAVGSGRYAARPEDDTSEGIVIVDVGTGAIRLIGRGRFLDQAVSLAGGRLAAIRRLPAVSNPRLPMVGGTERGPLVIFDLKRNGAQRQIGASPNVLPQSLRWSPSGGRLAFLTVGDNGSSDQPQLWIYDAVSGIAHRTDLEGLSVQPSKEPWSRVWRESAPFAWLGEDLAVLAQGAPASGGAVRADWFLLHPGAAPINLTAQLSQVPEVVAITRSSLLMSAGGQVWEVRANRKPLRLASDLGQRVRVVRLSSALPRANTGLPTSALVLEDDQPQGSKTVYFLDVASGQITGRVKAPAENANIRAISAAAKRVAFSYSQNNVDIIAVADASGASRELLRLNEFLKDKEIGTFVRIDHKEPKTGQPLNSWLLLPRGYRKGPPLPTVVNIYPGMAYGLTAPRVDPTGKALLLAAHGYAVLFPSLPIDKSILPREPLQGLADAVLSAVDAARSQGYVDGDRLAIQGSSYGGYGTLGVIGQTDRFKAAVAVAGSYDLLSGYGEPPMIDRLTGEFDGILDTNYPMGWSETGQGGMGVPPWRDPQRYLRNSPLLYADAIHTPVMLVHGDLDSAAPFTQSEEMFTALYRLNKDAVFVRYWGELHSVPSTPGNIRDYWPRVYAWYDTHIGPPFDVAKALSMCAADCR